MDQTSHKILTIHKFKNTTKIIKTYQGNNNSIVLQNCKQLLLLTKVWVI